MDKVILMIVTSIPILYQIVGLEHSEYKYIQYIPILFLNLALIYYFGKNKIKIKKEFKIIFFILFIAIFLVPLVMSKITQTMFVENFKYTVFYINFVIVIILLANYMVVDNYKKVIGSCLLGNTIILGINIIKDIDKISLENCVYNIVYLFKFLDKKEILSFGFNHQNFAAMFIIIEIFLLYKLKQSFDKMNLFLKFVINLSMCLWLIPLLATSSRGAIMGVLLFGISNLTFLCLLKGKIHTKIIISTLIILAFYVFLGSVNFNKITFAESMKIRTSDSSKLFYYLMENDKIITGLGPVDNTEVYAPNTGIAKTVDNGYLAFEAQYGIIGLGLVLSAMGYTFYINIKRKNNENCALIVTILIYSCIENVLFIPRVLMCLLVWVFIVNNNACGIRRKLLY